MDVRLIAHSFVKLAEMERATEDRWKPTEVGVNDIDLLSEFAGRACYQSWSRPNPKTAKNADYLANIVHSNHESVLEHASATFYAQGVSRSLTHELIRHRHLSYSQLSQRYVNERNTSFVLPPAIRDDDPVNSFVKDIVNDVTQAALASYDSLVEYLTIVRGLPRKQALEAARAVLPNATETKIVVTGNIRAWRDFLKKRWHVAADAEIREFAGEVLRQLRKVAPNSMIGIPDEPLGS